MQHPIDFVGRSLSISDVITIRRGNETKAFYVDTHGFPEVPEFIGLRYKYYLPGYRLNASDYASKGIDPAQVVHFRVHKWLDNETYTCGYIARNSPLSQSELDSLEAWPARKTPRFWCVPSCQQKKQIEIVGKWESAMGLTEKKRYTQWNSDNEAYEIMNSITDRRFANRFMKAANENL